MLAATSREELEGMFDVGGHAGWRACAVQVARCPSYLSSPAILSLTSCHLISDLLPSYLLSPAISSLISCHLISYLCHGAVQVARSAASLNSFSSFVIQSPTAQVRV